MKGFIRIIGDVHGHIGNYINLIKKAKYSVQLGDMSLSYAGLESVDVSRNRFVPGNHDNYDALPPHALPGDWGMFKFDDWEFLYIRGAFSVDRKYRIVGRSWWEQEEITWASGQALLDFVKENKPKVILSHDCPWACYERGVVTNNWKMSPSLTCQILSAVWEAWKPELWVFGHHHNDWQMVIEGTQFVCLSELSSLDIYPDGKKVWNPSRRM
jgi:predicted phosphodiesterase